MKILLLVNYFLSALALIIALPMAFVAPMMFDAPGSTDRPQTWLVFWVAISFPAVIIVSVLLSFYLSQKSLKKIALIVSFLPYSSALYLWFAIKNNWW